MVRTSSHRLSLVCFAVAGAVWGCHGSTRSVDPSAGALSPVVGEAVRAERVEATDPRVAVMGRVVVADGALAFGYPGVTLRLCFEGTRLWVTGSSNQGRSHLGVVYRGVMSNDVVLPQQESNVLLWQAPEGAAAREHCVDVVHLTETWIGVATLRSFVVEGEVKAAEPFPRRKLLFIGDSVTCGEAVRRRPECSKDESWWDAYHSYGAVAARALDAQVQLVCFGGRGVVRDWQGKRDVLNAPEFFGLVIPEEGAPAYPMGDYVPDAMVVSLGTNDFNPTLGAFPPRTEFVSKYAAFLKELIATYPAARVWISEGAIVSDANLELNEGATRGEPAKQKSTLRAYLQEIVALLANPRVRYLPAKHYPADTCDAHPTRAEHESMAKDVVDGIRRQLDW